MIQPIVNKPTDPFMGLRTERNRLLALTDWTQVADSPLNAEKQNEWKLYRQALRNMFANCSTPADVIWPKLPK